MNEKEKGPSASSGPGIRRKEMKPLHTLLLITTLTALSIWKACKLYQPAEQPEPESGQFIVIHRSEELTKTDSTEKESHFWPSMSGSRQTHTISPWSVLKTYTPSFNL